MKNTAVSIICIFICIFIVIFICSRSQEDVARSVTSDDFAVIEYDSCEYVIRSAGYQGFLAHKGNCKYCAKRRKHELQDVIKAMEE